MVAGRVSTQLVICGSALDGVVVKTVLLVEALVTVLLVPLGHAMVMPLVTVLLLMAVENVVVSGAAMAPEMPVVPVVAMVALDPVLNAVPVTEETVGTLAAVVNVKVVAAAMATPPELCTPVVAVSTQVAPSGMELEGVMVALLLPTVATVTVWLLELQLSVRVVVFSVDVVMAVEKVIENAEAMGMSVVPEVPMAVPLLVVKEATTGAADGDGAGLVTEVPHWTHKALSNSSGNK